MTEASVSVAGNLTDDPEVRYTEGGIARAMFRVAVSGRREQEASFFTVIFWRDRPSTWPSRCPRAAGSWSWADSGSGSWTAEDGSARQVVEIVAEELGPSLRWATATPARATKSGGE
jgi:single-strand DNA-binding protein